MANHNLITLETANEAVRITPIGLHSGMDLTVQNVSPSATVYLGGEGVTDQNYGFKLVPGAAFSIELPEADSLYATSSVNSATIATISFGLEGR